MRARLALAAVALLATLCRAAWAQTTDAPAESIQIGLSADLVRITADFTGEPLTIFGSIENADPALSHAGRYDVVVVLQGPGRPVVVRRKTRVLGIWINTDSETFVNVPESYSMASTRKLADISDAETFERLLLGADNLYMQPLDPDSDAATNAAFVAALKERKKAVGLYTEKAGGVEFLSSNLFRATLPLPPDIPVGNHRARAFLFRDGKFVRETSAQLAIVKSGFEQALFRYANQHSVVYGFAAVALAMVTGWLGRIVFRRD